MQFMKKFIDRYTKNTAIENISELWMSYLSEVTTLDNQCVPILRLIESEITCLINQYPKEWLVNEIVRDELLKYDLAQIRTFEPWWKLILGNKAILPLLWQEFPNHPNLLPAYFDDPLKI